MAKGDKEKKRLVILDTHAILHRAYHALPDFSSSKGEPTGALYGVISMLVKIINDLKPDYIVAAYDLPGDTFRHAAYEKYKATRVKTEDDLIMQIKRSRDVVGAFGIPMYDAKGFEADDVIGTIVEKMKKEKDVDVIIASGDMDALQLVQGKRTQVFTLKKGLSDTILYDEAGVVARYGFGPSSIPDYKGLRGDPSDNIPGVKGVGEKTATILISTFGTIEKMYAALKKDPEQFAALGVKESMVQKLKEQEEEARFSKMLAEIRLDVPVDFKLPKKGWKENVDPQKTLEMLAEFDFRSLIPRVRAVLSGEAPPKTASRSPSAAKNGGLGVLVQQSLALLSDVSQKELDKITLAVWVLNSNITEPTLEDVYRVGKSEKFEEAQKNILAEIREKKLEFVYEKIELPLMSVLRKMEQKGVRIDKDFLKNLSKEYTKELNKIAARIYKAAGGEFNINSPKQLGEVLFDKLQLIPEKQKKTAGGQRSTRESELVKMKEMHPIIEDILAHRELQKLLSTYIDTIPTLLDKEERLHTHFLQKGTSTGRLGSENPNVQNIPVKSELGRAIRRAFIAEKGFEIVALDYSQIELRIAALMTGDPGLIEIFKNNRDAHTEVASRVFKVSAAEVTRDQRRVAKVINFGILYGMGVNSLQQSLGTSRKEAQEFYNQYFIAFPKLADYMDNTKAQAARRGYTETYFGRRRYFDGIKSPIPYVRAAAERMAINAPLQGTSADLIKLAMVAIGEFFEKEKLQEEAYMLLQVHDELVFEIKKEKVKEIAVKLKNIMEHVIPLKEAKGIPFVAEGQHGDSWGEMKNLN
ncbi:MAG: DNA polymerase [bacterium]|nr:DNA polymerase [bacterium]